MFTVARQLCVPQFRQEGPMADGVVLAVVSVLALVAVASVVFALATDDRDPSIVLAVPDPHRAAPRRRRVLLRRATTAFPDDQGRGSATAWSAPHRSATSPPRPRAPGSSPRLRPRRSATRRPGGSSRSRSGRAGRPASRRQLPAVLRGHRQAPGPAGGAGRRPGARAPDVPHMGAGRAHRQSHQHSCWTGCLPG